MGVPCKGRMGVQRLREERKVAPWRQRLPGSCWALSGGFESCLRVSRVKCVWISSSKLRCQGRALFLCHLSALTLTLSLHPLCHSQLESPLPPCVVLQVGFSGLKGGGVQREQLPLRQWSTQMAATCLIVCAPGGGLYLWHLDGDILTSRVLISRRGGFCSLELSPCRGQRPTEPRMKTAVTFRTKLAWMRMKCGKPSLTCTDDRRDLLEPREVPAHPQPWPGSRTTLAGAGGASFVPPDLTCRLPCDCLLVCCACSPCPALRCSFIWSACWRRIPSSNRCLLTVCCRARTARAEGREHSLYSGEVRPVRWCSCVTCHVCAGATWLPAQGLAAGK